MPWCGLQRPGPATQPVFEQSYSILRRTPTSASSELVACLLLPVRLSLVSYIYVGIWPPVVDSSIESDDGGTVPNVMTSGQSGWEHGFESGCKMLLLLLLQVHVLQI